MPNQNRSNANFFSDLDTETLDAPHCDAMVLTHQVEDFEMSCTLIDLGASIKVSLLLTLQTMRILVILGFGKTSSKVAGQLNLTIITPLFNLLIEFFVVNTQYNMIMGRTGYISCDQCPPPTIRYCALKE